MPSHDVVAELQWRGLVHQLTDPDLGKKLLAQSATVYCGFDPTADSLHLGNLLGLINLARFQKAGHKAIAVAGGGTGFIGDPSGKSDERSLLTAEGLAANCAAIQEVISRVFANAGAGDAKLINNADWLCKLNMIDFLRDVGKHFTINAMVKKESVRARMEDQEHGISFTEFSYMLLQAYDFWHLYKEMNCNVQVGGQDQWGNITAGCELIRRSSFAERLNDIQSNVKNVEASKERVDEIKGLGVISQSSPEMADEIIRQSAQREPGLFPIQPYGLTWPLLLRSDGKKFGKTEEGALWLSAEKTSPYNFYQYFINVPDADAGNMLRSFTDLSQEEIASIEAAHAKSPQKREAQKRLAAELTNLVHGTDERTKAEKAAVAIFSGSKGGGGLNEMDEATLLEAFKEAPHAALAKARLEGDGAPLIDLMAESGLWESKGEAKRAIKGGGANLNDAKVSDLGKAVTTTDLLHGKYLVLRKGKKHHFLFKID